MEDQEIEFLLRSYLSNTISKQDLKILIDAIHRIDEEKFLELLANVNVEEDVSSTITSIFDKDASFDALDFRIAKQSVANKAKKSVMKRLWYASIAASVICALSYLYPFADKVDTVDLLTDNDVFLQDSARVIISSTEGIKTIIEEEKNVKYDQLGLELVFDSAQNVFYKINPVESDAIHTLSFSNPKGRISKLILSDGSTVYLNSNSTITYPSRFADNQRVVRIQGEAFFDVVHQANRPFVVEVNEEKVKVLGTVFNINSYDEKSITTSLLSGRVQLISNNQTRILKPGEEGRYSYSLKTFITNSLDYNAIVSWKDGRFSFNEDTIEEVLYKLKNWYDIEGYDIFYHSNDRFSGNVTRTKKLSELLMQLEKISTYKLKLINRRVVVMK